MENEKSASARSSWLTEQATRANEASDLGGIDVNDSADPVEDLLTEEQQEQNESEGV